MARVRTRKSFPQYWKQAADIEGDQAKEVKDVKSRKGLEFMYHKDKE